MSTWVDRYREAIGPSGYDSKLRRCLQTAILFEAKRCVDPQLQNVRNYERKYTFMHQVERLLQRLDFLSPKQREEILWRTGTSKQKIDAEIAWRRVKSVEKEFAKLAVQVRPFLAKGRSHQEAVTQMVRQQYEAAWVPDTKSGPVPAFVPREWEMAHNHVLFAFRLYYNGDKIDPLFPPPDSPGNLGKTGGKGGGGGGQPKQNAGRGETKQAIIKTEIEDTSAKPPDGANSIVPEGDQVGERGASSRTTTTENEALDVASILLGESKPHDERRKLLNEVREHLEILKEFEGVIPEEEIVKRKRELFLALPPAPPACSPSSSNKRSKN